VILSRTGVARATRRYNCHGRDEGIEDAVAQPESADLPQ
jgi:hypothetical protein